MLPATSQLKKKILNLLIS